MTVQVRRETTRSLELIIKNLETNGKVVKIGWFQNSRYPSEGKREGLPVATVAAINEYGVPSRNIPSRSFMRSTFVEQRQNWLALAMSGARSVVAGKSTVYQVLEGLGLTAQGDVAKKIATITQPPLSPRTIAARLRKRSNKTTVGLLTKPLIDTGLMLSSLSYRVEDE